MQRRAILGDDYSLGACLLATQIHVSANPSTMLRPNSNFRVDGREASLEKIAHKLAAEFPSVSQAGKKHCRTPAWFRKNLADRLLQAVGVSLPGPVDR